MSEKEPNTAEREKQIKAAEKDAKDNEPKFKDAKKWIVWEAREQVLAGGPYEEKKDAENAAERFASKRAAENPPSTDFRAVEVPHSHRV